MKQEIINEGNRLIAEFVGYKLQPADTGWKYLFRGYREHYYIENSDYPNTSPKYRRILLKIMPFDYDWNWLMPVVEKIEKMGYSVDNRATFNYNNFNNSDTPIVEYICIISNSNIVANSRDYYPTKESKILATWFAVVEFIKWHNDKIK